MRVIFSGSRRWTDPKPITTVLDQLPVEGTLVVVGYDPEKRRPTGVDQIVFEEAVKRGFDVECHPADWDRYGRGAGHIRNRQMAEGGAERLYAFWDGSSPGTHHMIGVAKMADIPVEVQINTPDVGF